jgi:hypothetical protein
MPRWVTSARSFFFTLTCVAAPNVAAAQVIAPRTVPVLIGQQFDILPSDRAGMAGVTIALDDTLIDPFVNPAKASRVRNAFFSIAPFFYNSSNTDGGGRTFPVSGVGRLGQSSWSGAGLFALQQLDRRVIGFDQPLSERSAANQYVMGILSRRIGDFSLGASAYFADLGAEEGIDLLYSGSDRIQQAGRAADVRIGVTRDWGGHRSFEALIVRSQFDMTHDVHYPAITRFLPPNGQQQVVTPERQEHNRDHTLTWGVHSEYSQAIGTEGWRAGWLATANRLSHPKIPDYRIREVITVPRDPGHTSAFNVGFGLAKLTRYTSFGMDVILEPIFSTTWAEALGDTLTRSGATLRRGAHSVDNNTRFSNAMLRFGLGHETPIGKDSSEHFGFQVGLAVQSISYRLKQADRIAETSRVQNEHWMEWSPTFGLKYRGRGFDAGYTFTLTCGAGGSCMPSCFFACGDDVSVSEAPIPGGGGVIASPTEALRFEGGRVSTHRFTVTMRIR